LAATRTTLVISDLGGGLLFGSYTHYTGDIDMVDVGSVMSSSFEKSSQCMLAPDSSAASVSPPKSAS
jgi:hypothetical protein